MQFVSYAQNCEDVLLWRALKHIDKGSYIDVGAQHPVIDSVSMAFYEKGWRGAHVEPNVQYAEELRRARPDEPVFEEVIGDSVATVPFYEIRDTGLSTCDLASADLHAANGLGYTRTMKKVSTLDSVFDRFGQRDIHWLKIDVEGFERQVIQGWQASAARPWIIVVESVCPHSQEDRSREWQDLLIGKDYSPAYFDGLNRYYLHQNHGDLAVAFGAPPNVFDNYVLNHLSREEGELEALRAQLASIQGSTSWRITAPFRRLRAALASGRS